MEHEALALVALDVVGDLFVEDGAQGRDRERLGLASGKEGRSVRTGKNPDLAGDGTYVLQSPAVGPDMLVEDRLADDLGFHLFHEGAEELLLHLVGEGVGELGGGFLLDRPDRVPAGHLALHETGLLHLVVGEGPHLVALGELDGHLGEGKLFLPAELAELPLEAAKLGDGLLGLLDRLDHQFLGDLLGPALDHRDALFGAGDDDLEIGLGDLLVGRVDDELTVDRADAGRGDGAVERDVRDVHGRGGGDDGENVRRIDLIGRDGRRDELDFPAEALIEKRPHGAIDQTGNENFLVFRSGFTFEESAGNLSGGIVFFVVLDGKRNEIETFRRVLGAAGRREDGGTGELGEDGAVRLLAHFTGFEGKLPAADFQCHALNHIFYLFDVPAGTYYLRIFSFSMS